MIADAVLERPVHFGPRRLCHVNMFVGQLERSIEFYTRIAGIELVCLEPPIRGAFFSNGNSHHDVGMLEVTRQTVVGEAGHKILSGGGASQAGLYHLGWEMPSEFDLVKAWQRAQAMDFNVNRTTAHRSSHSVYVSDVDGMIHEFYADVRVDWRNAGPPKSSRWVPFEEPPCLEPRFEEAPEIRSVPDAPVQPVRFSHAVLVVKDLARQRRFFSNIAGLYERPHKRQDRFAVFSSPASRYGFAVALLDEGLAVESRRGMHHFALQVADEAALDQAAKRLAAADIRVVRTTDLPHKRSLFVHDPDGMPVEFVCVRSDDIDYDALAEGADLGFLL